ncbi:MAG: hypothetical protein BWZ02_03044 [Lentisphaerae bacterium ADurb.BinA184]|nr:MAG: hypothetical protein BWZ02_03044 [Lentisphaerae bacterium ADurb.BinA184]
MGGYGSGRWYRWNDGKDTTEDSLPLDIRDLHRKGLLVPGGTFTSRWWRGENTAGGSSIGGVVGADHVLLQYSANGRPAQEKVPLDWTPCHYGGRRPWWKCPECARRAAVLYFARDHFRFLCRRCCDLAYPSQRERPHERARRKALAIRLRLGGSPNFFDPFPTCPKGMRLHTWWRLFREAHRHEMAWLAGLAAETDALCAHTDRLLATSGKLAGPS